MSVGKRLKRIREFRKMTQMELGKKIDIANSDKACENRITQIERDNRPAKNIVDQLASVLEVNPKAITMPDEDTFEMLMLTLFEYERTYNIHPQIDEDGNVSISPTRDDPMSPYGKIQAWANKYQELVSGKITEEDYEDWKYNYPISASVTYTNVDGKTTKVNALEHERKNKEK